MEPNAIEEETTIMILAKKKMETNECDCVAFKIPNRFLQYVNTKWISYKFHLLRKKKS